VADRGYNLRVTSDQWTEVCHAMERHYATGAHGAGSVEGVQAVGEIIATHFPPCRAGATRTSCRTGRRYFDNRPARGPDDMMSHSNPRRPARSAPRGASCACACAARDAGGLQRVPARGQASGRADRAVKPAGLPPLATHVFPYDPKTTTGRRDGCRSRTPARGHAGGHRAAVQPRLRRSGACEPGRGSVAARRGHAHRPADAVRDPRGAGQRASS
jgi:hypothetical protein